MKKVFSILMIAFALTAMVACGDEKDNAEPQNNNNNNNNNPSIESVDHTLWTYTVGTNGQQGYQYVGVGFDYGMATVNITTNTTGENEYLIYGGAYTYSNGSGTITLNDVASQTTVGTATFSISGSTMTLNALGSTYTLSKN